MVTVDGRTGFHTRCSVEEMEGVARAVDDTGDVTAGDPDTVLDHEPDRTRFPAPALPGLRTGAREVLGGCGWRRPTDPT
ncbi:hypothetical protein DJ68_00430, partial [Halorubrum sp. C3]